MGIGAIGGNSAALHAERPKREPVPVEAQRTAVTRADIRGAIARAHEKVTGRAPSAALLDTLTAQASLETASGASMYNYNFGGIKGGAPGTNETARLRTKEVKGGKEVEVRDGFRAYRSLDAGAEDYVRLMRSRFGAAVDRAEVGDINGFAHALKQAHYYTADEAKYANALNVLSGKPATMTQVSKPPALANFSDTFGGGLGASSSSDFADTVSLGRVFDAIARHPVRAADDDDDDE
ncbi:MAG: glucosaminidase domain-containing protein [Labilithrix sp.]|nr:glucosaminidase domain-containing protein [Labilithrix sp.]MCW5817171.1 glucosaminidase domain-containing protein [Labilithrix sp.]